MATVIIVYFAKKKQPKELGWWVGWPCVIYCPSGEYYDVVHMKESSIGFRPKYLLNFVDAVYYVHHIVSMAVLLIV